MSEAELDRRARERFARDANRSRPPRIQLTSENLAQYDSNAIGMEEPEHVPLTEGNLSQHDADLDEAHRPVLSAADLARRNAAVNDQQHSHLIHDDVDYRHVG
jgi:hypothetical protein